ncbi:MAG: hypothetical protein AMXMBFR12_08300 [Candidatus Babeliales bacterium]
MKIELPVFLLFPLLLQGSEQIYDQNFISWCMQTKQAVSQPYYPIISLGINCQVAYQLRIHGLRYEAYPFDWIICPFDALIALIENKFKDFLAPEYLQLICTENEKYILNNLYGIKFLHDFKLNPNFMDDYEKVRSTYERRIHRFYQKLSEPCRALVIRRKISKEQANQLKQVLQKQFPLADFLILAVDNSHEIKEDWNIAHVKNCYLPITPGQDWKGDSALWTELFTHLNLNVCLDEPQDGLFKI